MICCTVCLQKKIPTITAIIIVEITPNTAIKTPNTVILTIKLHDLMLYKITVVLQKYLCRIIQYIFRRYENIFDF